jgi:hypothetical protein
VLGNKEPGEGFPNSELEELLKALLVSWPSRLIEAFSSLLNMVNGVINFEVSFSEFERLNVELACFAPNTGVNGRALIGLDSEASTLGDWAPNKWLD